jgi:hypothetical protein
VSAVRQAGIGVLVRTEAFKVASSRWQPVALLAVVVLHVPPMLWSGQEAPAYWEGLRSRSGLFVAYTIMIFGVLVVAQEYRHRTAELSFLAVPGRHRITAAQCVTVAAAGLTMCSALFTAWLAVGVARYGAAGMHLDRPTRVVGAYGVVAVTVCAAGMIGVGLGTILRGSTGALVALGSCAAVEPLTDATRFLGPATSPLGVLAWPTSELEITSLCSALGWGVLALVGALIAVHRDLTS